MVDDDNNGKNKSDVWYIVISVVGAAIIIGAIVGIVLYNKKKNKQPILIEDENLGDGVVSGQNE